MQSLHQMHNYSFSYSNSRCVEKILVFIIKFSCAFVTMIGHLEFFNCLSKEKKKKEIKKQQYLTNTYKSNTIFYSMSPRSLQIEVGNVHGVVDFCFRFWKWKTITIIAEKKHTTWPVNVDGVCVRPIGS